MRGERDGRERLRREERGCGGDGERRADGGARARRAEHDRGFTPDDARGEDDERERGESRVGEHGQDARHRLARRHPPRAPELHQEGLAGLEVVQRGEQEEERELASARRIAKRGDDVPGAAPGGSSGGRRDEKMPRVVASAGRVHRTLERARADARADAGSGRSRSVIAAADGPTRGRAPRAVAPARDVVPSASSSRRPRFFVVVVVRCGRPTTWFRARRSSPRRDHSGTRARRSHGERGG